jgi:exosortase H (IPTLxxWG-CTERM-specific)
VRQKLIFAGRFAGFVLLFYLIVALNPVNDHVIVPFSAQIARIAAAMLRIFEGDVATNGTTIVSGRFSMDVENGCNAVETMILFAAAVLAFPASVRDRLVGLAIGLPSIQAINISRLLSLFLLGVHRPDWFSVWHIAIWQTVIILIGVALFVIWSSRIARHRR